MSHDIYIEIPRINVKHTDMRIVVNKNGAKIGELLVSKGNVEWWPKGNFRNKKRMKWSQLDELFREHGKTVKE